ncbi:MAG: CCA tRNA nucleotidyltransferase [Pseudomonadota bacterium]
MDRSTARKLNPDTEFLRNPAARGLCTALGDAGFNTYFVGGCVRNAVMDEPITDIDIATDAVPDRVIELCEAAGFKCIATGIDHGTVTVVVNAQSFEVTTFRKDVATDGRRAVVAFSTDLAEDAHRRDFTMNALYANAQGIIFDPVGGYEDAQARKVRFIEDAGRRIREDYLRTLRYFRFCAQYSKSDAAWDADALAGISANLDGLETLSAERITLELLKLLGAPNPSPALSVMYQTGVLPKVLPGAEPTFVGPFVHFEQQTGIAVDPIARLAALGGYRVQDRLRLSRRDQRHLESICASSNSSAAPKVIGYLGGRKAGQAAIMLKAAYTNCPADIDLLADVARGADAVFPIAASDLPHLSGSALGAELKRLKQLWLASNLSKSKAELLAP